MDESNATSATFSITGAEENAIAAGMGRPIPYFPQETITIPIPIPTSSIPAASEPSEPSRNIRNIRRPPPLNLAQIPDDDTYEWYANFFSQFYRLLKQAEESFPLLAQYHRSIADALADTPTPHGPMFNTPNTATGAHPDTDTDIAATENAPRVRFA